MTASLSNYQCARGVNVGIDVANDTLEVAVRPDNEQWSTNNRIEDFPALIEKLQQIAPERIIIEATGAYEGLKGVGEESGVRNFSANTLDVVFTGQVH